MTEAIKIPLSPPLVKGDIGGFGERNRGYG